MPTPPIRSAIAPANPISANVRTPATAWPASSRRRSRSTSTSRPRSSAVANPFRAAGSIVIGAASRNAPVRATSGSVAPARLRILVVAAAAGGHFQCLFVEDANAPAAHFDHAFVVQAAEAAADGFQHQAEVAGDLVAA